LKEFENKTLDFIKKNELIDKHDQLMVAVSGGIDSVVLVYTLARLSERLGTRLPIVAHVNHKLRTEESDRDEKFVKKIADDLGLHFISESFEIKIIAKREKKSIQETARKYRLRYLEEMALKLGCNKIATGHNQDDLAETTLMWIARGAGLKGASGIVPKRGKFIRPLLACSRQEISSYAEQKGLIHVEDSSNSSLDYIRNVIRHQVLPLIEKKCYPGAKKNIARFSELLRQDSDYLDDKSYEIMKNLTILSNSNLEISIDIDDIIGLHSSFRGRVIRQMINEVYGKLENIGFHHVEKILDLCAKREGGLRKLSIPGEIEVVRSYSKLTIRPYKEAKKTKNKKEEFQVQYPGTTIIEEMGIRLDVSLLPGGLAVNRYTFEDPYIAFLNFDKIVFPLKIRKPRQGDSFTPLGSSGTKKLSDYFIDSKISSEERWHIPLLLDAENIIWISGYRINDTYRINPSCKNVLMVKVSWL
jgi:tRNA(Ile)-lysidine synthase